jgi:hypothetical protein
MSEDWFSINECPKCAENYNHCKCKQSNVPAVVEDFWIVVNPRYLTDERAPAIVWLKEPPATEIEPGEEITHVREVASLSQQSWEVAKEIEILARCDRQWNELVAERDAYRQALRKFVGIRMDTRDEDNLPMVQIECRQVLAQYDCVRKEKA